MHHLVEVHQDIALHIMPSLSKWGIASKALTAGPDVCFVHWREASAAAAATSPAEELFEKVAKPSAAEVEFESIVWRGSAAETAALPAWGRLKATLPVPISAERVVFLALFGIAQDFIGFIDLLEFLLR